MYSPTLSQGRFALVVVCSSIFAAPIACTTKTVVVHEFFAPVCRRHRLCLHLIEVGNAELFPGLHFLPTTATATQPVAVKQECTQVHVSQSSGSVCVCVVSDMSVYA